MSLHELVYQLNGHKRITFSIYVSLGQAFCADHYNKEMRKLLLMLK
jgi:hypothetical protein